MMLFRLILALALVTVGVGGGHQYKDVQKNQRSWDGLDVVMVCTMVGLSIVLLEQAAGESWSMDTSKFNMNFKRSKAAVRTKQKRLQYVWRRKPELCRVRRYKRYQCVTSVSLEKTLNSPDSLKFKLEDCCLPDISKTPLSTTSGNLNSSSLPKNSFTAKLYGEESPSENRKETPSEPSALRRLATYIAPVNLNDPRPRSWPWPQNINIWPVTSSSETVPTTDKHPPLTVKYSLPMSWPWPDVINVWPATSPPEDSAKEDPSHPRDIISASTTEKKCTRIMREKAEKGPTALVGNSSTTKPDCKLSPLDATNLKTSTKKPDLKPNHPTKSNGKSTSATLPNAKLKPHEDSRAVRDDRVILPKDCDIRPQVSNNMTRTTKLKPTTKVRSIIEAIIAAATAKSPKEQAQYESKRNISNEDKQIYHPLTNSNPASHSQKLADTTSLKPNSQSQKRATGINPTLASQLHRQTAVINPKPAAISDPTPAPPFQKMSAATNPKPNQSQKWAARIIPILGKELQKRAVRSVSKSTQSGVLFSSKSTSRISLKVEKRNRKLSKSRGVFEDGQYKLKSIIPEPAAVPVTKAGTRKTSNINKMIEFYNKL